MRLNEQVDDPTSTAHCERDVVTAEIEITAEMIDAGADAILGEVGGADLGGHFSAPELARRVYLAMATRHRPATR